MPATPTPVATTLDDHIDVAQRTRELEPLILQAAEILTECLLKGGTILLCGNGGSAADAQHLAGEWVGRFLLERRGLPSIALHTNTTAVTAIANDYGFEEIFSRQVEAHARPNDVLIAITTSGNSENVIRAARRAKELGIQVIGMTGEQKGRLASFADLVLNVPSPVTARVQEMHITIGHILCDLSEQGWAARK